jgi:hypothetical protein
VAKQTITQRSFVIGEPREEFLEADDLDLRLASLRMARNVRIKATRTIDQKLGSIYKREISDDYPIFEVRPYFGETYAVAVESSLLSIWDVQGNTVYSNASVAFGDLTKVWVEGFGEDIVIGCENGLYSLTYTSSSVWALGPFVFAAAPGGELAQPYWAFVKGLTMQPSALTGSITLTASADFFTPQYVGLRIRYNYREVLITAYTSPTQVTGTVVSRLPPTYRLTLSAATSFRIGDAVIGQDTDFQGIIVAISGSDVDVVTLRFLDGPDISERISGPSATATVSAKSSITPAASNVWDEPLISSVRGFPQAAAGANGRLILCDFPAAQDVICGSSAREIFDFLIGAEDDDAIVRTAGDNSPRFLHVINAGDLLLLSDRGIYVVELQGNKELTPSTFVARLIDRRGASPVNPVQVDDGVLFVDASGEAIAAAQLDGNIYLKWSVRTISTFHDHLIKAPTSLCGPPANNVLPEKYLFITNSDGTLAVMSWVDGFDAENVGFVQWDTEGTYLRVVPVFGQYWPVVRRTVAGVSRIMIEEFTEGTPVDCALPLDATMPATFNGQSLHVAGAGWYGGTAVVASGAIAGDFPDDAVAGFNYVSRVGPWPQEQINHPKAGILAARVIRLGVSVLHTGPFSVRCNNITQNFGGLSFGDAIAPSPGRTKLYKTSVLGRRDHPEFEITKPTPGLFQILAVTQEVAY